MRIDIEIWQQEDGSWAAHVDLLRLYVVQASREDALSEAKKGSLEALREMLDQGAIAFETVEAA